MRQADNECDIQCNVLWDGFGRWMAGYTWKPYINSTRNGISYFRNPKEEWVQTLGAVISGIVWVDKR